METFHSQQAIGAPRRTCRCGHLVIQTEENRCQECGLCELEAERRYRSRRAIRISVAAALGLATIVAVSFIGLPALLRAAVPRLPDAALVWLSSFSASDPFLVELSRRAGLDAISSDGARRLLGRARSVWRSGDLFHASESWQSAAAILALLRARQHPSAEEAEQLLRDELEIRVVSGCADCSGNNRCEYLVELLPRIALRASVSVTLLAATGDVLATDTRFIDTSVALVLGCEDWVIVPTVGKQATSALYVVTMHRGDGGEPENMEDNVDVLVAPERRIELARATEIGSLTAEGRVLRNGQMRVTIRGRIRASLVHDVRIVFGSSSVDGDLLVLRESPLARLAFVDVDVSHIDGNLRNCEMVLSPRLDMVPYAANPGSVFPHGITLRVSVVDDRG